MNVEIFFLKQKYTERQTKKSKKTAKITDDQHLWESHQKGKHKNGKCY